MSTLRIIGLIPSVGRDVVVGVAPCYGLDCPRCGVNHPHLSSAVVTKSTAIPLINTILPELHLVGYYILYGLEIVFLLLQ